MLFVRYMSLMLYMSRKIRFLTETSKTENLLVLYWDTQYVQKHLNSSLVSGFFFPENNLNRTGHCYIKACSVKAVIFYYDNAECSLYHLLILH